MKHLLFSLLVISSVAVANNWEDSYATRKNGHAQKRNRDAQRKARNAARKKGEARQGNKKSSWADKWNAKHSQ